MGSEKLDESVLMSLAKLADHKVYHLSGKGRGGGNFEFIKL